MNSFLKSVVTNDLITRAGHTFLQSFLAALLVSAVAVHDLSSGKAVLLAAVAAGISAAKTAVLQTKG